MQKQNSRKRHKIINTSTKTNKISVLNNTTLNNQKVLRELKPLQSLKEIPMFRKVINYLFTYIQITLTGISYIILPADQYRDTARYKKWGWRIGSAE